MRGELTLYSMIARRTRQDTADTEHKCMHTLDPIDAYLPTDILPHSKSPIPKGKAPKASWSVQTKSVW